MPFFDSNIPSQIFYSFIGSKIFHLARNISGRLTFIMLVNKLLDRISKQGSRKRDIKILLNKIVGRYFKVLNKFAATAKSFHILF